MKTFILGDIHGEYIIFTQLLFKVGLIEYDEENCPVWREGCTDTLIQVGDMIDGHSGSIACYNLLRRLQQEASKEGGTVVRLVGNHELGYLHPDLKLLFNGYNPNTDLVLSDVIRRDILDGTLIATYILDEFLISHAGYDRELPIQDHSANLELQYAVRYNDYQSDIFNVGKSRDGFSDLPGIFWSDWRYDILDFIPQIVGHTAVGKIEFRNNHINVDCGISRHAQRVYEILKYENKKFEVITL